jgi:hypothetical protein
MFSASTFDVTDPVYVNMDETELTSILMGQGKVDGSSLNLTKNIDLQTNEGGVITFY